MADRDETSAPLQGWAGVFAELIKSFMILRDIFGYALPGAVFFGVGLMSGRITLRQASDLLQPYTLPMWAGVALVVVVCYITGQILAAIAYAPYDLIKWATWRWLGKPDVIDHPTEVSGRLLAIQQTYPRLFVQLERRETMALLYTAMLVALLAGWLVFFHWQPSPSRVCLIAGLLLLPTVGTAMSHLRRVQAAIREANTLLQRGGSSDEEPAHRGTSVFEVVTLVDDER